MSVNQRCILSKQTNSTSKTNITEFKKKCRQEYKWNINLRLFQITLNIEREQDVWKIKKNQYICPPIHLILNYSYHVLYVLKYRYVENFLVPNYVSWECDIFQLRSKSVQQRPLFNLYTFHSWVNKEQKIYKRYGWFSR